MLAHHEPALRSQRAPSARKPEVRKLRLGRAQCMAVFLAFLVVLTAKTLGQSRVYVESRSQAKAQLAANAKPQAISQAQARSQSRSQLQSKSQSTSEPQFLSELHALSQSSQSQSQSRSQAQSQSQLQSHAGQATKTSRIEHQRRTRGRNRSRDRDRGRGRGRRGAGAQGHPQQEAQHQTERKQKPTTVQRVRRAGAGAGLWSEGITQRGGRARLQQLAGRGEKRGRQEGERRGRRDRREGRGRRMSRRLVEGPEEEMVGRVKELEEALEKTEGPYIRTSAGTSTSNSATATATASTSTASSSTSTGLVRSSGEDGGHPDRLRGGGSGSGSHGSTDSSLQGKGSTGSYSFSDDSDDSGSHRGSDSSSDNGSGSSSHSSSDSDSESAEGTGRQSHASAHSDEGLAQVHNPNEGTDSQSQQHLGQHLEQHSQDRGQNSEHHEQNSEQHAEQHLQDPEQHSEQDVQHSEEEHLQENEQRSEQHVQGLEQHSEDGGIAGAEATAGKLDPRPAGVLGRTIHLADLVPLALNPLDHFFQQQARVRFTCNAPLLCPQFQSCPAALSSRSRLAPREGDLPNPLAPPGSISVCDSGFADDPSKRFPLPPANCRRWWEMSAEGRRALHGRLPQYLMRELDQGTPAAYRERWLDNQVLFQDPSQGCAHRQDFIPEDPVAFGVYRLENMFVSREAILFNETSLFLRNGCQEEHHEDLPNVLEAGEVPVVAVPEVINWAYRQGSNFYHSLIESFPLFLSLAPILSAHPDIPFLGIFYQFELYKSLLEPLVGVPLANIKRYEFNWNDRRLFKVDTLYQGVYQFCGHPSVSQWTELRRRHLLHPQGIPMFNPDWSLRGPLEPLSDEAMRRIPGDWVVMLVKRTGPTRRMMGFWEVHEGLVALFSAARVVVYHGSSGILEARVLLMRTRLLIGIHGAAMANMVFMPAGADVLEIRPEEYTNACYHSLADACSLQYNLVMGKGRKSSNVTVDVPLVLAVVKHIAQRQGILPAA